MRLIGGAGRGAAQFATRSLEDRMWRHEQDLIRRFAYTVDHAAVDTRCEPGAARRVGEVSLRHDDELLAAHPGIPEAKGRYAALADPFEPAHHSFNLI